MQTLLVWLFSLTIVSLFEDQDTSCGEGYRGIDGHHRRGIRKQETLHLVFIT